MALPLYKSNKYDKKFHVCCGTKNGYARDCSGNYAKFSVSKIYFSILSVAGPKMVLASDYRAN